jgi:cytochrome c peroxidase
MSHPLSRAALAAAVAALVAFGSGPVAAESTPTGALIQKLTAALADPVLAERADAATLPPLARLGRQIYTDTNLSEPKGQSCASCHDVRVGFTDPNKAEPTSRGAVRAMSTGRNSPPAGYADFSPPFHFDTESELWIGGQFWDGRASTLEEQAGGPFLGPVEMNNPSKQHVIDKVRKSAYARDFTKQFGAKAFDDVDTAYRNLTVAIAAYERSKAFQRFNSKYDAYLLGQASLSPAEARGLALFNDPAKGNCAACHVSEPARDPVSNEITQLPLFTDYSYDNLGVPKNPANRFYGLPASVNPAGAAWVDLGLGGRSDMDLSTEVGKFKVPSLRNIAVTGPYMHNGYFSSLRNVVEFYNARDVKPACKGDKVSEAKAVSLGCWPAPEVATNVNRSELGNLGLTRREVDDIVAFMNTLTDGYVPR